ncbi:MAG: repeat-containing protein [Rickettsiaceae bacterium]|nr:repeat-containing protein [Rickettsiaceae bacterium]
MRNKIVLACIVLALALGGKVWATPEEAKAVPELNYKLVGDYVSGGYALRNDDTQKAASIFAKGLKKDPDSAIMLKGNYLALLKLGKINRSVDSARKYLEQGKIDPVMAILLSAHEINNKEYARAKAVLDRLDKAYELGIASSVGMVIVPFLKAWALAGQGKFDQAYEYQESAMGNNRAPSLFMYYQNAMMKDIAGHTDEADDSYSHLVKNGIIIPYHFAKSAGNFYERMGRPEQALAIYEKYRAQPPQLAHFIAKIEAIKDGEATTKRVIPDARVAYSEVLKESVRILFNSGFYEDGLIYLRLVLFINPEDEESNMLLASYYERKGEFKKAIDLYKRIKRDSDFFITSRIGIADDLYSDGKKRKAVRELLKIIGEEQSSNIVLLTLADLLRKDMKFERAAAVYSRIINAAGKPEVKHWPIFFARGICYERAGQWNKAEVDLLKALELRPDQPEILNYLGYSWIDRDKNLDDAKNMVAKAVKARPTDAQIIDSMGWALFKTKDYTTASRFLERAAELMPYDPVINDHLGDAYWKQGRYREARFQWERVLRYKKDSEEISEKKVKEKLKDGLPVTFSFTANPAVKG